MSVIPKMRRIRAGLYVMEVGSSDEHVKIRRASKRGPNRWIATPWRHPNYRHGFLTKQQASEWAYDWLVEYA